MLDTVGIGALLIVNVRAVDSPPAGAGLNTVTGTVPAVAISAAVTVILNRVEETYVVA